MKSLFLIFVIFLITACSFDNKTGIWNNSTEIALENNDKILIEGQKTKRRFEDIFTKNKIFNEEKDRLNYSKFDLDPPIMLENWLEKYGNSKNNISNFSYSGDKILISKTSRLSRSSQANDVIFNKNNLITYDHKGEIFVYSLDKKKILFEYNFYKKKFKRFQKVISLIIDNNILYAADNLGYIYAINLNKKSLIWAKNYGIPFRSNLKFINGQIILANQDNTIFSINSINGQKNWQFETSVTFLKTDFMNSFAIDKNNNNLFFLNTNGELYSINYVNESINWVINFKRSGLADDTNLFLSQPIILKKNNLIIVTENSVSNYNYQTSSRNWIFSSKTLLRPILTTDFTFTVAENNLLICLDNQTGEVIWSQNIYKNLSKSKMIKKIGKLHDFKMINGVLSIFSENGYLLSFDYKNGKFKSLKNISKKGISSEVILVKNYMFMIDNNNRLLKFN